MWQWQALDDLTNNEVLFFEVLCPQWGPSTLYISEEMAAHTELIERFVERLEDPRWRLWLAALVGDWLMAAELVEESDDQELRDAVGRRAEQCVSRWLAPTPTEHETRQLHIVRAIHQRGRDYFREHFDRCLRDPEWARAWVPGLLVLDDEEFAPEVYWVLGEIIDASDSSTERCALECARFLLRHGYCFDRVAELVSECMWTDEHIRNAALLLLEYAPRLAMPSVRRALREGSDRSCMVMVLAGIDQPWSRWELRAILDENDRRDPEYVLLVAVALRRSRDPDTRTFAENWTADCDHDSICRAESRLENGIEYFSDLTARLQESTVGFGEED